MWMKNLKNSGSIDAQSKNFISPFFDARKCIGPLNLKTNL